MGGCNDMFKGMFIAIKKLIPRKMGFVMKKVLWCNEKILGKIFFRTFFANWLYLYLLQ
jgi:hypothetical protein